MIKPALKSYLSFSLKRMSLGPDSSKPIVECSVVTEFTDHICVTMDAELIMFLHDLVSAYLKEKEKGFFGSASFRSFVCCSAPLRRSLIKQQEEPHVRGSALCVPADIFPECGGLLFPHSAGRSRRPTHSAC